MPGLYLQPPEIKEVQGEVIYLAGPLHGAPIWQLEAARIIHEAKNIYAASQRDMYGNDSCEYLKLPDWENYYHSRSAKCGAIMYWLAKQTSIVNDSNYAKDAINLLISDKQNHHMTGLKMVVGIEHGFLYENYIRRSIYRDSTNIPLLDNLRDTVMATVQLLD